MSKMKEAIQKLVDNQATILMYIPATGYVFGKVHSLDDDVVTLQPDDGHAVVIHYTQFSLQRDQKSFVSAETVSLLPAFFAGVVFAFVFASILTLMPAF